MDWIENIAKIKHSDHQQNKPETTPYITENGFVSDIVNSDIFRSPKTPYVRHKQTTCTYLVFNGQTTPASAAWLQSLLPMNLLVPM